MSTSSLALREREQMGVRPPLDAPAPGLPPRRRDRSRLLELQLKVMFYKTQVMFYKTQASRLHGPVRQEPAQLLVLLQHLRVEDLEWWSAAFLPGPENPILQRSRTPARGAHVLLEEEIHRDGRR